MAKIIEPRVLKGFRDFLPGQEIKRRQLQRTLEDTYKSFGFVPIDTPVLEYTEVLLGKGSGETDKQIYRFNDHGKRDVSMRFDLTVPFARYMAAHRNELYLPFKRYHMAKVFRGENTQRGRFREFTQCDFDIVGTDSVSADFEILLMMVRSMQAIGINGFTIHFSHRGIFSRFLKTRDLESKSETIMRTIDKLGKIGEDETKAQLTGIAGSEAAGAIIDYIKPSGSFEGTLEKMTSLAGGPAADTERIAAVHRCAEETGIEQNLFLDPSIARGLDYYTGIVFETILTDLPGIGSICSGGRYNDLASLYTKEKLPGVGSSIGLDRLLAALEELQEIKGTESEATVLVFCLSEEYNPVYHRIADRLRREGVSCEVYPEAKKMGAQFSHAEKKSIPIALIIGEDEIKSGTVSLKILETRESLSDLTENDALQKIRSFSETSSP
jgi:histidyl-tRNA synthetase